MKKRLVFGLLYSVVCCVQSAFAEGYNIDLIIRNDAVKQTYYLGCSYGYQHTIIDSATLVKPGVYRFSNPTKSLPAGIYYITQNRTRIDFVIENSADFSIEVDHSDLLHITAFKNSAENAVYKRLLDTLTPLLNELQSTDSLLRTLADSTSEYNIVFHRLTQYSEQIQSIKTDFSKKNPNHIMTLVFGVQTNIEVPNAPKTLNTQDADEWQYQYYKLHYFDHFNFEDSRLARTPVLYAKIDYYLSQVAVQHPDSLIVELAWILGKTKQNSDIYQNVLDYLTLKFDRATFIGQDAVWAFLVEHYYLNGKAEWASPATLENYSTRLKKIKPWLIGANPPEIWYPDTSNNKQKMTSLFFSPTPYTIIIFWEPDCPHCKREIARLKELYRQKHELGFEIIAIARDPDLVKTKKIIADLNLPFVNLFGGGGPGARKRDDIWIIDAVPYIYILDQNKRILAKKISAARIEQFIRNHNHLK